MLSRAHIALDATLLLLLLADGADQRFFAVAIPWSLWTLWVVLDGARQRRETERREDAVR